MTTPVFGPGCPWFDLHARFPPNIDWCEEKLCAVVVTPFNSWTNLAYLIAAALMWAGARRATEPSLRLFAPATAITGLTSFAYHQSLNMFSQLLDFFGMYAFCILLLMANLRRMHRWPDGKRGQLRYWQAVVAMTGLTAVSFWLGIAAQLYVGLLIVLIIVTELAQQTQVRHFFWASVLVMAVASVLSALDLTRTVCDAANHWLQLHGLWHVLTAIAIYLAFLHVRLATHQRGNERASND
ncbi:MAG: ceramidase domain-containing protein [Burkholderiaceae bacterium]